MKLKFEYGNAVTVLPAALIDHLTQAEKRDLQVLLALAAHPVADDAALDAVAASLGISRVAVDGAVSFWRGTGVITVEETAKKESKTPPKAEIAQTVPPSPAPRAAGKSALPDYTMDELSALLTHREELRTLIDASQQVFGKVFNHAEVAIIAGMADYLGYDGEYILLLLAHCRKIGKNSLRYAEKLALSLYDDGVTNLENLRERLHRIEMMNESTGFVRSLFGTGTRAWTAKEKAMVEKWTFDMKYGEEVIKLAYDATVNATQKPSLAYANSILERWYAEGYRTAEEVRSAIEAEQLKKAGKTGSSFDVDSAFEAALKRTYGG